MIDIGIVDEYFCLGVGCMDKCSTCQHLANWNTLNNRVYDGTISDEQRIEIQSKLFRINESRCQITSGSFYLQNNI